MKKAFDEAKTSHDIEMEKAQNEPVSCETEPPMIKSEVPFATSISRPELIAMIPVKGLVELLVDAYFRNFDPLFRKNTHTQHSDSG